MTARMLAVVSLLAVGCGSAPPPKPASASGDLGACIGGLCVKPDHAIARKVSSPEGRRCLILAWDGDAAMPPTAKVSAIDESPARPGVFLAIELPSFRTGFKYRVSSSGKASATSVFSARVDPAVQFADQRVADQGEVLVVPSGDDLMVLVKTIWAGREETAQFVVPKSRNGCGTPSPF